MRILNDDENKFFIQDSQYEFPYHYIPYFDNYKHISLSRRLSWGFEYLCYQKHIYEKVIELNPSSFLEVGCGDGYFIGRLPDTITVRTGIDLSEKAILFAKAFHHDIDFRVQNISEIKDKYDIVAAIEVLEHIHEDELSEFLMSLSQRISDNGCVIISVPTTVIPLNKKHYRHYTYEILEKQVLTSGSGLFIYRHEYVFSIPWWYKVFCMFYDNSIFSLEFKPIMRYLWNIIWNKYRISSAKKGYHLIAVLKKGVGK